MRKRDSLQKRIFTAWPWLRQDFSQPGACWCVQEHLVKHRHSVEEAEAVEELLEPRLPSIP
jgi:hypothetical protein